MPQYQDKIVRCPHCHKEISRTKNPPLTTRSFPGKIKIRSIMKGDHYSVWFWRMLAIKGDDDCWEYQGYRQGYPGFEYGYVQAREFPESSSRLGAAHRLAYELHHNIKLRTDQHILHTCDNPPCCNPKHLKIGTPATNAEDMKIKGRSARGEKSNTARLTDIDVQRIRNCEATTKQLACIFGVSYNTIANVRTYRTWRHVPNEEIVMTTEKD